MKSFTIVCPTDFSECSLNAIEYAAKLGEKYQAKLILFHVPNREDYQKLAGKNGDAPTIAFARAKLMQLVDTVNEESISAGLASCSFEIREGDTVESILHFSNEVNADLIIMGTEGVNEFKKNYVGTRTSNLVEKTNRDVFVIPRKVFFKNPRKLVYATDYLEEDKLAIQKVTQIATFFDSEIDVLHVGSRQKSIDKALHQSMINEISPFLRYEKTNFVLKSYRDDPGLGLESYLITAKGDILFTLSKKKSWFEKLFTNNLSKKMSYFINKPLFVIKNV
ncbi:universal stress protein [Pleomorphovibrio marinus]|uniref:universal stress protein n=1 Tax=Pleomorphovibrio marinus TaxID=2164132 RepID=UPI000E0A611F|nr:universal stress protein [Pleomorphovibrio marinus]